MATSETKLQIVVDAVNKAGTTFDTIGRNLDAVSKKTADMRAGMMTVGAAGTVAFAGLALVTTGAIKAGASFEQTEVAFTTMLGSAEKAKETLADLATFAAATPFQLPEVQEAAKQLLAYGFSTKELIPTLTELGNVAAGLNIPMSDMAYLFGTLKTQGRAFSKDIYQFSARGIPILDELAKVLGVSKDQVMGLVEEGKVGFAEVQQAFVNMSGAGGQFNDLMADQSQTLAGQWSNFKDQITLTAIAIGTQLMPYLKPLLQDLISVVNVVKDFAVEHPKLTTAILLSALAITALMAALLPIAIALPGLILMWGALAGVTLAALIPFALVIAGMAAVAAALIYLTSQGYATKEAWQNVWLGIKVIAAEAANAVISTVEGMVNFILSGVNKAIDAINKVIKLANKVPGVKISTIGSIANADFGRIDTNTIAANDLAGRSNPVSTPNTTLQIAGNVLLDQNVATEIGNLIFKKLGLSTAF